MYRNRTASVLSTGLRICLVGLPALAAIAWTIPEAPREASHPFRLSVADVRVADAILEVRIRFFWDDLQFAVMENTSDMDFVLSETPEVDTTIQEYINEMLVFRTEGTPLAGTVIERGVEDAVRLDEVMWWYRLRYPLPASVERVHIRNRLLFNMFEDQRNLVNLKTRSGAERTYYFTWDEDNLSVPVT